jgi:hypothetical protein
MMTMTGNVVEHLDDTELLACHASLVPGGHLNFGSRNPNQGQRRVNWDPQTTRSAQPQLLYQLAFRR